MKSKYREMLRTSLNQRLEAFKDTHYLTPPPRGWLHAIRTALGIPLRFPAGKLKVSTVAIALLEKREASGRITLKNLAKAADALGCDLVYGLVPRAASFDELLSQRARQKAANFVRPIEHSMALEQQATGKSNQRIEEIAADLSKNPRRLWTDT
jgi:predicted DNA-binding mobile mystery protein A